MKGLEQVGKGWRGCFWVVLVPQTGLYTRHVRSGAPVGDEIHSNQIIFCAIIISAVTVTHPSEGTLVMNPTTRTRTGLFLSYRDSRASSTRFSRSRTTFDDNDDEEQQLISHHVVDMDLPPKWSHSLLHCLRCLLITFSGWTYPNRSNSF